MTNNISNPAAGYYVDESFEYDIRHFKHPYNNVMAIRDVMSPLIKDGWNIAFRQDNNFATFIVLVRMKLK